MSEVELGRRRLLACAAALGAATVLGEEAEAKEQEMTRKAFSVSDAVGRGELPGAVALVSRRGEVQEGCGTSLLRDDATLSMPPYALWLRGRDAIRAWLLERGSGCRGSRLVATAANGLPAFGQYRPGVDGAPHQPWALAVLELSGEGIVAWNSFLDTETLFPRFGLPPRLAS